jgi:LPXTG-site transpeptidase (sortase) family protein
MIKKLSRKIKILIIIICSVSILSGIVMILYPNITNIIANSKQQSDLLQWNDLKKVATETILGNSSTSSIIEGLTDNQNDTLNSDKNNLNSIERDLSNPKPGLDEISVEDFFPLKITIPKIEIEWIVNEGTDIKTLKKGPGHYTVTALPGETGRCAIAGHRTTYGAPFNKIDLLEIGDLIYLETKNGFLFTYSVTGTQVVRPEDVYILKGTIKKELLLTACEPKFSGARRYVIFAELLEIFPLEIVFD